MLAASRWGFQYVESCPAAAKFLIDICRNRSRMRYTKFRAQGLWTSSGVIEAGCKVSIVTRLKRTGMHWTLKGANAIIAFRCCHLSGRAEDFRERRHGAIDGCSVSFPRTAGSASIAPVPKPSTAALFIGGGLLLT